MSETVFDALIVGQGIAGTLVHYLLRKAGKSALVVDPGLPGTASRLAAGMFSPVSGKRFVRDPQAHSMQSEARSLYREMERLLGIPLLHECVAVQLAADPGQSGVLRQVAGRLGYEFQEPGSVPGGIADPFGALLVPESGWLHVPAMLDAYRSLLFQKKQLIEEAFDYSRLELDPEGIRHGTCRARAVVFCEGIGALRNPYFLHRLVPCKGDVLTVEVSDPLPATIVKRDGVYLVPLGGRRWKVGATYKWNEENLRPDPEAAELLLGKTRKTLSDEVALVGHQCGIRPTTPDRAVIAARHPGYRQLYFFNGLGTKGVSVAPHYAARLVAQITGSY